MAAGGSEVLGVVGGGGKVRLERVRDLTQNDASTRARCACTQTIIAASQCKIHLNDIKGLLDYRMRGSVFTVNLGSDSLGKSNDNRRV